MRSPELEIVGITTAWGDTALRARLAQRLLSENAQDVPIAVGIQTKSKAAYSQAHRAQDGLPFQKKTSTRWISCCSRPINAPMVFSWHVAQDSLRGDDEDRIIVRFYSGGLR